MNGSELKDAYSGPQWGFMERGVFIPLPKLPMLRAGMKDPPFDVKLPSGEIRHVIVRPE